MEKWNDGIMGSFYFGNHSHYSTIPTSHYSGLKE
jgi:hypothetical protein